MRQHAHETGGTPAAENAHTANTTLPKRRQTRRQLVSNALRRAKRLSEGNAYIGYDVGHHLGESLASAVMLRNLTGDEPFGFWLCDLITELVPSLRKQDQSLEDNIRTAMLLGVCREYDKVVRWAYERGAFKFTCDDEADMMRRATQRAAERAKLIKSEFAQTTHQEAKS